MKVHTLWGEDEIESRLCKKCGTEKPITHFESRGDLSYTRGHCLPCGRTLTNDIKRLHKENPYPKDHSCDICGLSEDEATGNWKNSSNGKKKKAFCLDHDHTTRKFRGWLCHDCNRAMGQFKDNVEILDSAIKYLRGSSSDENVYKVV